MLYAVFLLLLLATAGCPRQTNETVPMPRRPQAVPQPPVADRELTPPIEYLALGSQMEPALLPGEILEKHPGAEVSPDGSKLWAQGPAGAASDWYQAFTTPANEKTLRVYFDGLLKVKGFDSATPSTSNAAGDNFALAWRPPDGGYTVEVYAARAAAAAPRIYIIQIRDYTSGKLEEARPSQDQEPLTK